MDNCKLTTEMKLVPSYSSPLPEKPSFYEEMLSFLKSERASLFNATQLNNSCKEQRLHLFSCICFSK